jgi:hypothetical protein
MDELTFIIILALLAFVGLPLAAIEESSGAARLEPQPDLPWKKWLLWTLLILVVIVTGRMAFNLYREMNASPST